MVSFNNEALKFDIDESAKEGSLKRVSKSGGQRKDKLKVLSYVPLHT